MRYLFILLSYSLTAGTASLAQRWTAVKNTNIIDVRSGKILPGMTVLMKDDLIEQVASDRKVKIPSHALIIDGTGRYIMPGLMDGHIHFFQSGGLYTRPDVLDFRKKVSYKDELEFALKNAPDFLNRYLRLGITSVADVGGPFRNFVVRDSISPMHSSPNVLVTGPLFSMVDDKPLDIGDPPIVKINSPSKADSLFQKMLPHRPDFIKIWYIHSRENPADKNFEIVKYIAAKAHQNNLRLAVHATELRTAQLAVEAGADILVHSVDDEIVPDNFVKELVAKKVTYIPTLVVMHGYYKTFSGKLNHHTQDLYWANPFAYRTLSDPESMAEEELPPAIKYFRKNGIPKSASQQDSIMSVNIKKLVKAGVNVVTGTDAGNIGTMHASSYIQELEAMQRAGLTNAEILKAATINAATGFGKNWGLVEKTKQADLIILTSNPLESLHNLNSIEYVIKSGSIIKADTIVMESPAEVVQRQVNAYNARNLKAFLDTYSDDVELYDFSGKLLAKGKDQMEKQYEFFNTVSYLHCEITNRMNIGNKVIDYEKVRFNDTVINAVAIYEVKSGKIVKVTFIQ